MGKKLLPVEYYSELKLGSENDTFSLIYRESKKSAMC